MRRFAVFVCSFGYVGFFPIAPGTAGSAAGVAVYALLHYLGVTQFELPLAVAMFALGVWLGTAAEKALGSIDPGVNWIGVALGFVLFRALDVWKPFPAGRLEQLPGGLGMMADDAMAGIYANVLLQAACYLAPSLVS